MIVPPLNRKDMAEFFRLSLLAGLGEPSTVARWAESIVAAEAAPHIALIELCIAGSQPATRVQTLLHDVPGQATPELPVQMLLGYASCLVSSHAFTPEQLLFRLRRIASRETFPEKIYSRLDGLEDEYALARDGAYGTLAEVERDVINFLHEYEPYAADNSAENTSQARHRPATSIRPSAHPLPMSAIASFIKLPATAVEELRTDYDQCVEERGQEVADYGWSGYVLSTLLSYLQEHDIDLMHSSYDALATHLCQALEATVFILTPAHREAYLPKLSPTQFSGEALRDYFNEFNDCDEPEMGQAMLDGIASLQESLASLDVASIILLTIG